MGTLSSLTPGLVPHQQKGVALNSNYLQFTDSASTAGDFSDFAAQYLPELYEAEVERYGNRTIGGFLRMVGAEMPMSSDQVIWSEQNRLHVGYETCAVSSTSNEIDITLTTADSGNMAIKKHQNIVVQGAAGEMVCRVDSVSGSGTSFTIGVHPYTAATLVAGPFTAADAVTVFVFGSEYHKGSSPDIDTITPQFQQYNNKPIILRDEFMVNGSDTAQIGWVEVATEDGTSGYLWYLKAESETRLRFEDYMEMSMMESVKKDGGTALPNTITGSEGLFAAIKDRGNVMAGLGIPATGGVGAGAVSDFDAILKQLDKEGSIEENMLFVNRSLSLTIDDMLSEVGGASVGGTGFGLFNNDGDMALNLGFSGFRRGSYDFYKSDWKYLNDASTRGILGMSAIAESSWDNTIEGCLVPAGTSTVYDQVMGQNIRRPFLHVRYRASEMEDRRMKSWITGSVGGAYTSNLDAMEVHFLSERCLCVQGANNFVLFTT